jgi:hypothetical protein
LKRLSSARFESVDGKKRIVGLCSKRYASSDPEFEARYWFGFRTTQKEFLSWQNESWIALECAVPEKVVLLPFERMENFLRWLNVTEGVHWHVEIFEKGGQFFLNLSSASKKENVTECLVVPGVNV